MKKVKLLIWLILPIVIEKGFAQIDTIKWDNNRYTLINELGKVWIEQYKGSMIKNVKIHKIDTSNSKIEYINEGTLHDVFIYNIRKITPGKYYNHFIRFTGKIPTIFINTNYPEYDSFKYNEIEKPIKKTVNAQVTYTVNTTKEVPTPQQEDTAIKPGADARIVFENGKYLDVKLVALTHDQVSYKRMDLLNGPLYVFELTIPGTLKKAKVIRENGLTTIDYSK